MVKPHLKYLSYVIRHKWFVFLAGRKTGAPLWRLIIHDWSKFTPAEWVPYVNMFYGPSLPGGVDSDARYKRQVAFDAAWLHHQHRNQHHWQHWVLRKDDGDVITIPMPTAFIKEMVADWMGAGRAITGKWEVADWYRNNSHKMILEDHTRLQVVMLIRKITEGTEE